MTFGGGQGPLNPGTGPEEERQPDTADTGGREPEAGTDRAANDASSPANKRPQEWLPSGWASTQPGGGGGAGEPPPWGQGQSPPPYGAGRGRGARHWFNQAPNLIITLAVLGIIAAVLVAAVRRGYLSSVTVIYFLVAIPSIMFHEVTHGIVALWCGDDTAKQAGRISANPLRHVDPIGTIVLPAILALSHGPIFGWAKPVPVRIDRLRHPRNQAVLVGLAGPVSNYLLAAIAGGLMHVVVVNEFASIVTGRGGWYWTFQVLFYLGLVNVLIGTFNLIPIPPLDGSAIIERLLPQSALPGYYRMRMGFMILVLFFVFFDQSGLASIYNHVSDWYLRLFLPGTL